MKEFCTCRVANAISLDAGNLADCLENSTFSQATLSYQNRVFPAAHKIARYQLLDAPPIQSLGVEFPIKALEGRDFAEVRRTSPETSVFF